MLVPMHPCASRFLKMLFESEKTATKRLKHTVVMNSQILVRKEPTRCAEVVMELGHPIFLVGASWCLEKWVEKG